MTPAQMYRLVKRKLPNDNLAVALRGCQEAQQASAADQPIGRDPARERDLSRPRRGRRVDLDDVVDVRKDDVRRRPAVRGSRRGCRSGGASRSRRASPRAAFVAANAFEYGIVATLSATSSLADGQVAHETSSTRRASGS